MAYANEQAVERAAGGREKLIQLTDLDASGQVDSAYLTDAIAEADSWIDAHIQTRFAVPVAAPPPILRNISSNEAVYILKQRREALTDGDQVRHEERAELLESVRKGEQSLGIDPRPPKSTSVIPAVGNRENVSHALTRDRFEGWT